MLDDFDFIYTHIKYYWIISDFDTLISNQIDQYRIKWEQAIVSFVEIVSNFTEFISKINEPVPISNESVSISNEPVSNFNESVSINLYQFLTNYVISKKKRKKTVILLKSYQIIVTIRRDGITISD